MSHLQDTSDARYGGQTLKEAEGIEHDESSTRICPSTNHTTRPFNPHQEARLNNRLRDFGIWKKGMKEKDVPKS
jgi:hypothetical protein